MAKLSGTTTPGTCSSPVTVSSSTMDEESHPVSFGAATTANRVSYISRILRPATITKPILEFPYPGKGTAESPHIVDFLPGGDDNDPRQLSPGRRWAIVFMQAGATFAAAFASSAYSGGMPSIMAEFNVSPTIAILGLSFFVLGIAVGPTVWAPLSESYGRQRIFFTSYLSLAVFNAAAAGAQSAAALIAIRFVAGSLGSAGLTNSFGILADLFDPTTRAKAGGIYTLVPFLSPALGPIIGGFLGEAAGWRWVQGLIAIMAGLAWAVTTVTYQETYTPVLLRWRAAGLAKATGRCYVSTYDAISPPDSVATRFKKSLLRPWVLFFSEPIVFLNSIYIAIVYGTLYMNFAAFPIVYLRGRGWRPGIGGLPFFGIFIGMVAASLYCIYDNKRYNRVAARSPKGRAPAEARLPPAILGSVLLPVGLFWFAWTNGPETHYMVSICGAAVYAAGILLVYLTSLQYLIDAYGVYSASVVAATAILRSIFGATFPIMAGYMYRDLGIHWGASIPAFLTVACLPCPFLFHRYGARIRARCKFSADASRVVEQILDGEAIKVANGRRAAELNSTEKIPQPIANP